MPKLPKLPSWFDFKSHLPRPSDVSARLMSLLSEEALLLDCNTTDRQISGEDPRALLTGCHPCRVLPFEVLALIECTASDTPTRAAHNAQTPSTVACEGMSLSSIVFPSACTYTLVKSPCGMDRQRQESLPSLTLQAVQLCCSRTSKVV